LEYVHQLVLSSLLSTLRIAVKQKAAIDKSALAVGIIVQSIRGSFLFFSFLFFSFLFFSFLQKEEANKEEEYVGLKTHPPSLVTENPETHNSALLLLATIASIHPESILASVMPIFTFMGANVLRQDDNYSFYVIQQTLEKVIPPLLAFHDADSQAVTVAG